MDNSTTVQYATLMFQFTAKARSSVRDIDPQNDLTFVRIRTKKHEIMIAPGKSRYSILCIPTPNPLSATHPSHSETGLGTKMRFELLFIFMSLKQCNTNVSLKCKQKINV